MSSADPATQNSISAAATATAQRPPKAVARPVAAPDPVVDDANVRSEKPQPNSWDVKTDRPGPEADQAHEQGTTGVRGAFQKHPVAMIVCHGLIVIGIIAGIAWYLHARHYES